MFGAKEGERKRGRDGVLRKRFTKNTQGAEQSFCVNGRDHGFQ